MDRSKVLVLSLITFLFCGNGFATTISLGRGTVLKSQVRASLKQCVSNLDNPSSTINSILAQIAPQFFHDKKAKPSLEHEWVFPYTGNDNTRSMGAGAMKVNITDSIDLELSAAVGIHNVVEGTRISLNTYSYANAEIYDTELYGSDSLLPYVGWSTETEIPRVNESDAILGGLRLEVPTEANMTLKNLSTKNTTDLTIDAAALATCLQTELAKHID